MKIFRWKMSAKLSFTFKHFKFPLFPLLTHSAMLMAKSWNTKKLRNSFTAEITVFKVFWFGQINTFYSSGNVQFQILGVSCRSVLSPLFIVWIFLPLYLNCLSASENLYNRAAGVSEFLQRNVHLCLQFTKYTTNICCHAAIFIWMNKRFYWSDIHQ